MPAVAAAGPARLGSCRSTVPPRGSRGGRKAPPLVTCFAHTAHNHHRRADHSGQSTYERILRYPDGVVRRIRYPAPVEEDSQQGSAESAGDSWEALQVWKPAAAQARQSANRPDQAAAAAGAQPAPIDSFQEAVEEQQQAAAAPEVDPDAVPDSPLQLLRYLTSDSYKASQRELARRVQESYEVLVASPWVAPRPLFVLATPQPDRKAGLTYSLRTRVGRPDQEDELTRVLGGRRRPDGGPIIECAEVVDGVVAFESEAAAGRYADELEREGALGEVEVVRCDSHELFRGAQDARSVVVLLCPAPADGWLPQPHQLAAALRGQRSMEEGPGAAA